MPFTSVVFPAPRSPCRMTMRNSRSFGANSRPSAMVSSAEWVMYSSALIR